MAAQKGKDLLLKVDSDGVGSFVTVAGLRSRSLAFNAESVDVTHSESAGRWRELLEGAGVRSARVTGAGIFKDAASDEIIRGLFFNGAIRAWQIVVPDFGAVTGAMQVTSFELTGRHDGEVTFELSLESAGELTFVAM
ncbi:MAG: phage major tail protein, TP901-1 family [Hyphomicrobiaceae bacterium]